MEVHIHPWLVSIVLRIKLLCGNFYHQAYLEGFHKFCEDLGGTTADVMCPILQVSEIFLYVPEQYLSLHFFWTIREEGKCMNVLLCMSFSTYMESHHCLDAFCLKQLS